MYIIVIVSYVLVNRSTKYSYSFLIIRYFKLFIFNSFLVTSKILHTVSLHLYNCCQTCFHQFPYHICDRYNHIILLIFAPGSLWSSADILCLAKNSSEGAQEATAADADPAQAATNKITTKYFMVTGNTNKKQFNLSNAFVFTRKYNTRVREVLYGHAARERPHWSAFYDWITGLTGHGVGELSVATQTASL